MKHGEGSGGRLRPVLQVKIDKSHRNIQIAFFYLLWAQNASVFRLEVLQQRRQWFGTFIIIFLCVHHKSYIIYFTSRTLFMRDVVSKCPSFSLRFVSFHSRILRRIKSCKIIFWFNSTKPRRRKRGKPDAKRCRRTRKFARSDINFDLSVSLPPTKTDSLSIGGQQLSRSF